MRDVAVIAFAQMPNVRRETVLNEVEMLMPVIEDVRAKAGLTQPDIGFTCSGSTDYLSGQAFSFVSTLDGIGPWPPDPGEPRRDGRRLRALRGVGEAAARRRRHRARLLLRQVGARPDPRGAQPPARPVPRRPAVARRHQPRRPPGAGPARRRQGHARRTSPRSPPAAAATPSRNPNAQLAWDRSIEDHLDEPLLVDPLRKERLPADHRRRLRGGPRRRRPGPRAPRAPGVDPRHRPPHRADGARPARPHHLGLHPRGGGEGRRRRAPSTSPSCTPRSAPRS